MLALLDHKRCKTTQIKYTETVEHVSQSKNSMDLAVEKSSSCLDYLLHIFISSSGQRCYKGSNKIIKQKIIIKIMISLITLAQQIVQVFITIKELLPSLHQHRVNIIVINYTHFFILCNSIAVAY